MACEAWLSSYLKYKIGYIYDLETKCGKIDGNIEKLFKFVEEN